MPASTIIQKPHRRLIRELPLSLRPATRLARVGSDQLTITELMAIVLNTTDALDLAEEIVCEFAIENLPQTTLTELQQPDHKAPNERATASRSCTAAWSITARIIPSAPQAQAPVAQAPVAPQAPPARSSFR